MVKNYDVVTDTDEIKKELEVMKILEGTDGEIKERLEKISGDREKVTDFLDGLATEINYISVCYRYKDTDNIYKLIRDNEEIINEDESLQDAVIRIDRDLKEYNGLKGYTKLDHNMEYISIQEGCLHLREEKMTLSEFNSRAIDTFEKILDSDISEIKKDSCYLPVVLFLVRRHSTYFLNYFPKLNEVMNSLSNIDKNEFSNRKEYRIYNSGSQKVLRETKHQIRKEEKNKVKKK